MNESQRSQGHHWIKKRLKYVASFPGKREVAMLPPDMEVSFVPMDAIGTNGGIRLDAVRPLGEVLNGFTYFRDNDIAIAKITPCFENGKGALAVGLCNGIAFGTTELHILRAGRMLLPSFLFYTTISYHFRKCGEGEMYGAGGQKRIPERFIRDYLQPIPPLDIQKDIVRFLDRKTAQIDALISKKERLIALLKKKRQASLTSAVTKGLYPNVPMTPSGIDWLGRIPKHWRLRAFRYSATIRNGQVDPEFHEYRDLPLIAPNHIESGTGRLLETESAADQAAESGKYLFEEGEVLYSKIRPALAKVCMAPCRGLCSADMYPIKPAPDLRAKFLFYFMLSRDFTNGVILLSDRVAMPKMNRRDLGAFRIPIPPIGEQIEIVEKLDGEFSKIERLIAKVTQLINQLYKYRSALITAAVTGQIDVTRYRGEALCQ